MKFTLSWLKEHLDTEASVNEIAETLTRIGLEVEEVFDPAAALKAFRVAEVVRCDKHPDADKLQVLEVDTGKERLQVVCGAPNARVGLKGVFAPVGAYVPGSDLTLTKAKIRGVESNGMMLSERELELSEEHAGIIELLPKAKVGSPAAKALGLDDAVFDIAITPNRPDCLGVRGVARDLAAAGLGKLKKSTAKPAKGSFDNPVAIKLEFAKDSGAACPIFAGRLVRGVKNGPSPDWLQRRLRAIGLRPINALVDITNYIAYDRARPLHVYDADKLSGAIRARRRSGIRAAGAGACHPHGHRAVRRQRQHGHGRRQDAEADAAVQVRHDLDRPLERAGAAPSRHQAQIRSPRRQARGRGQRVEGHATVVAPGHHRPRRSRGGGGAAHRRRSRAVHTARTRLRRRRARAHRAPGAAEAGAAPACCARPGGGGDVVVRAFSRSQAVRRRSARTHAGQSDLHGAGPA